MSTLPTAERYTAGIGVLPNDPDPGEVYTAPEGQEVGASYVLTILLDGKHIGHTSQISRVPNVSKRSHLNRTITTSSLEKGDTIEVVFTRYAYKSVIFVEYFGWIGHEVGSTEIQMRQKFSVVEARPLLEDATQYIYEKVCLKALKE